MKTGGKVEESGGGHGGEGQGPGRDSLLGLWEGA